MSDLREAMARAIHKSIGDSLWSDAKVPVAFIEDSDECYEHADALLALLHERNMKIVTDELPVPNDFSKVYWRLIFAELPNYPGAPEADDG
jgi:hypothetical protein